MLMTLVLTKSYSGNLMSLLAVRHVPQPFQSIRDVLNDPHVGMIWQKYSRTEEFLRSVQSGIFREVAELEDEGRLTFHTQAQYLKSFNTLVRAGDHVLVDGENTIKRLIALDFSQKGRCDFYISKDGFFPFLASIMSQKTNPIIQGLNPRAIAIVETGLLSFWAHEVPNLTRCDNIPKKVVLSTSLSTTHLSGMFAVLGGGLVAGTLVWLAELLVCPVRKHCLPRAPTTVS
ncbi:uncharacterized protein LOC123511952 [Portunus trituberculatus]|uniref:uncharacterized protein LOC123511952 n=1 Tax=Portunus trituberculatus TaxID=210409 RepID=UPI001E1D0528|nr:uncharacterized protein LOC123511952 [Portunus trituberculatus]